MKITTERLEVIGFKRYRRDGVYRIKIGNDILNKPMYLTVVQFTTNWTWYVNPYEQYKGLKTIKQVEIVCSFLTKRIT